MADARMGSLGRVLAWVTPPRLWGEEEPRATAPGLVMVLLVLPGKAALTYPDGVNLCDATQLPVSPRVMGLSRVTHLETAIRDSAWLTWSPACVIHCTLSVFTMSNVQKEEEGEATFGFKCCEDVIWMYSHEIGGAGPGSCMPELTNAMQMTRCRRVCGYQPGSDSRPSSVPGLLSEVSLCKLAALAPLLTNPCSRGPEHDSATCCKMICNFVYNENPLANLLSSHVKWCC